MILNLVFVLGIASIVQAIKLPQIAGLAHRVSPLAEPPQQIRRSKKPLELRMERLSGGTRRTSNE